MQHSSRSGRKPKLVTRRQVQLCERSDLASMEQKQAHYFKLQRKNKTDFQLSGTFTLTTGKWASHIIQTGKDELGRLSLCWMQQW
eukprot:10509765-Ditylum_brightwellii.AAC.1